MKSRTPPGWGAPDLHIPGKGADSLAPSEVRGKEELLRLAVTPCLELYTSVALEVLFCGRPEGHSGMHFRTAFPSDVMTEMSPLRCAGCDGEIAPPGWLLLGGRTYDLECAKDVMA